MTTDLTKPDTPQYEIPRRKGALPILTIYRGRLFCHFYADGWIEADEGFPSYGIMNYMGTLFWRLTECVNQVAQSSSQFPDGEIHEAALRMAELLREFAPWEQDQAESSK